MNGNKDLTRLRIVQLLLETRITIIFESTNLLRYTDLPSTTMPYIKVVYAAESDGCCLLASK